MNSLFLKTAFRSLLKNKRVFFINLISLSLGFVATILISIYAYHQLSIDKHLPQYDQIYRLEVGDWSLLACGMVPAVAERFPEVEYSARLGSSFWENTLEIGKQYYDVPKILFADGDPLKIFDLEILQGDPETALDAPGSIVISQSLARRIFRDKNPIGQTLNYNERYPLTVKAVMTDLDHLHLEAEAIINFETMRKIRGMDEEDYHRLRGSQNYLGYFILNTVDTKGLSDRINSWLLDINAYGPDNPPEYWFRPIDDIYFNNNIQFESGVKHGNLPAVKAFIFIALFIMIIAGINYINISTAQGFTRAREIGLRKILGSGSHKLRYQFLTESFLLCFFSFLIALLGLLIVYPLFANSLDVTLPPLTQLPPGIYLILTGIYLLTAILGGLYPALYLSMVPALEAFKVKLSAAGKGLFFRRALILIQFTIAIFLTVQAVVVLKQYTYMKNQRLGFNKDQLIHFEMSNEVRRKASALREALLVNPLIESVSYVDEAAGSITNTSTLTIEATGDKIPFRFHYIDPEYYQTMGIELISGQFFSRERPSEQNQKLVINEKAARAMGFEPDEIIGYQMPLWGGAKKEVIGVVKDYHFNSLNSPIEPLVLNWYDGFPTVLLKVNTANLSQTIRHIESCWSEFSSGKPLTYQFMDESFDRYYTSEKNLSRIILLFTILAITIAATGIYGMSMFMAKQVSRSISIRKVLGANTGTILRIFSLEYIVLVFIACLIALPPAILYSTNWLDKFPYKTNMAFWIFLSALLLNLFVALGTILFHALKTAHLNPARVLRQS